MEALQVEQPIDIFDIDLANDDEISAALTYLNRNFEVVCEDRGKQELFTFLENILITNPGSGCAITEVLLGRHQVFMKIGGHQSLCAKLARDILEYPGPLSVAPWITLVFELYAYAEAQDMQLVRDLVVALLDDYPYFYTGWQFFLDLLESNELKIAKKEMQESCAEKILLLNTRTQAMEGYRIDRNGQAVEAEPFIDEEGILYNEAIHRDDLPHELLLSAVFDEREGDLGLAHEKTLAMVTTISREDFAAFFEFLANLIRISRKILSALEEGTDEHKSMTASLKSYEAALEENKEGLNSEGRRQVDYLIEMVLSEPDTDFEEHILHYSEIAQGAIIEA